MSLCLPVTSPMQLNVFQYLHTRSGPQSDARPPQNWGSCPFLELVAWGGGEPAGVCRAHAFVMGHQMGYCYLSSPSAEAAGAQAAPALQEGAERPSQPAPNTIQQQWGGGMGPEDTWPLGLFAQASALWFPHPPRGSRRGLEPPSAPQTAGPKRGLAGLRRCWRAKRGGGAPRG